MNKQIIKMRKNNAYLSTILKYVIERNPLLDELVLFKGVLNLLDKNELKYTRKEVRTAMNKYYRDKFHSAGEDDGKQNYLNFLAKNAI